tara:strand:+ start:3313 stop:3654 length:342 start_codon:yes stop_codon:yes gene_type:complete
MWESKMKYLVISFFIFFTFCHCTFGQSPIQKRMITKTYHCAPHEFLTNDLIINHGEGRQGWGVSNNNQVVEFFINKEKGTWTIIFTGTDGISCGLIGGRQGFTLEEGIAEKQL